MRTRLQEQVGNGNNIFHHMLFYDLFECKIFLEVLKKCYDFTKYFGFQMLLGV
jgi:hypothetical protein